MGPATKPFFYAAGRSGLSSVHRSNIIKVFLLAVIISSSLAANDMSADLMIVNEGTSAGITWKFFIENDEYYFTDRIPVILQMNYSSTQLDSLALETLKKESIWGDFRLYEIKNTGLNSFLLILQPLKTGLSVFKVPSKLPFAAQFELQIISRLSNEESEPLGLIENESGFSYLVLFVIILLITITIAAFLFIKKRKNRKPATVEPILKDLIKSMTLDMDEDQCLGFYRNAYRLLNKELCEQHPMVKISDSPLELMAHLETPSAMNQWALRSLYPLLKDWDRCFFAPRGNNLINKNLDINLEILKAWVEFSMNGEVGA